jgi:hypothetical protein
MSLRNKVAYRVASKIFMCAFLLLFFDSSRHSRNKRFLNHQFFESSMIALMHDNVIGLQMNHEKMLHTVERSRTRESRLNSRKPIGVYLDGSRIHSKDELASACMRSKNSTMGKYKA